MIIEPNEVVLPPITVQLNNISENLPWNQFELNVGPDNLQISNVVINHLAEFIWQITLKVDRNTSGMVKFGHLHILAYAKSVPGQNYTSNIMPLSIDVTQHPSSY